MNSSRPLRPATWLLVPLAVAAAAVVGWAAGPHVGHSTRLFPLVVLGLAGGVALVTAVVLVDPAWILSVGLGLSIFSGSWGYMHIPGPLDRVFTLAGVASVVIRSLTSAEYPKLQLRKVHWLMGLLILYAAASGAAAGTLSQHTVFFELLDRLGLVPFLLYLVAPAAFATERQRAILLSVLVVAGGYLGLTAVFEIVGPKVLVFPSFIKDQALGIHYGRARGPFLEAAADGLAMFCCAVAATMLLPKLRDVRTIWAVRAVIVLCLIGIVLSLTREVWLGSAVAALVAAGMTPRLRRKLPLGIALVAILVGALLLAVPGLGGELTSRTNSQQPVWDRLNSDAAALRMAEARPALGFGWGSFPSASPAYYHVAATYPLSAVSEVHNVVLSNAAELGIAGLVMWAAALIVALVTPWAHRSPPELEPWRLGLVAVVIAWFVQANFTPLSYAFDNYLPYLFAAIAAGGVSSSTAGRSDERVMSASV